MKRANIFNLVFIVIIFLLPPNSVESAVDKA